MAIYFSKNLLFLTLKPKKVEPRRNPEKNYICFRKNLTPENFNVFRGLNGGRDKDRTCDPYDVNVVLSR